MGIIKCIWNWIVASLFVLGSVFCFAMAVWLTLADKIAGATLMASMFVVLMLMHYLPQMEYFKAYGIEAKMRQKLNEADEILAKLKAASVVSGKLAYHVFGWGSRVAHPVRQKQAVADDVDALLKGAGVSDDELAKIKWQYLRFLLYDFDNVLIGATLLALQKQDDILVRQINERGGQEDDPVIAELRARRARVDEQVRRGRRGLEDHDVYEQKLLEELPPDGVLDADLQAALIKIKDQATKVGDEAFRGGRLNSDGAEMIESGGAKVLERALRA
jgi:hypothetical protein